MKSKVVVCGIGSFAEYVAYLITHDSPYQVAAFCVEMESMSNTAARDTQRPIVDFNNVDQQYPPTEYAMFVAIEANAPRRAVYEAAKAKGYELVSVVSSKAVHWDDLQVGDNVLVSEGCVLQSFVSVGSNTIINIANIGHHSRIGADCLLSCCTLGGNVTIADNVFVGMSTTIRHGTRIAADNIIGMGSVINRDTAEGEIYSEKPSKKRSVSSYRLKNRYL